jgi:hypothetical protein
MKIKTVIFDICRVGIVFKLKDDLRVMNCLIRGYFEAFLQAKKLRLKNVDGSDFLKLLNCYVL